MSTVRILFDLRSGVGIGDSVQMSIMWRHLRRFRPHWVIDVRAPGAFSAAIRPFVHAFWPSEEPDPTGEYESVQALGWTDVFQTFPDRPSTKVAYALKNVFGIEEYDPALGGYEVEPESLTDRTSWEAPVVACHFDGNSHKEHKDLTMAARDGIRRQVADLAAIPCGLSHYRGVGQLAWAIGRCKAFIGIDSGPGKIASATDTPTLICWTGHHPLRYHDPAPNTTHLIPTNWRDMDPFHGSDYVDPVAVQEYFRDNYRFFTYRPGELAQEACRWLRETLT